MAGTGGGGSGSRGGDNNEERLRRIVFDPLRASELHIVSTNFARGVEWGTLSKAQQRR
ncbi:unnamed protein product, partial [Sphagnum balticum]